MTLAMAAAALAASAPNKTTAPAYPVVELRQYTLHNGQRDTLIDLFEKHFIEPQEALGIHVFGTFRDLDRPNRFVWLRGFTGMDVRATQLSGFYFGPVWKQYREAANATMIDSDNVLLLHAADSAALLRPSPTRPGLGEKREAGLVVATIYYLRGDPADAANAFETKVRPRLQKAGVPVLGWFVPESEDNNFPRLPVREHERVLVWLTRFKDDADRAGHAKAFAAARTELSPLLERAPEVLRLQPTDRSELR
jgi:quinol monooxygenase YgiN